MSDKKMKLNIQENCLPVLIVYGEKEYVIRATKEKKLHMSRNKKEIDKKDKK